MVRLKKSDTPSIHKSLRESNVAVTIVEHMKKKILPLAGGGTEAGKPQLAAFPHSLHAKDDLRGPGSRPLHDFKDYHLSLKKTQHRLYLLPPTPKAGIATTKRQAPN